MATQNPTDNEFFIRKVCKEAGLNYYKVKLGILDEKAWIKLTRAAGTCYERIKKINGFKKTR